MASFLKNLKIADSQSGKVLTTDGNGKLISSNKSVADLADTATTNSLDERLTIVENELSDVGQRLSDING